MSGAPAPYADEWASLLATSRALSRRLRKHRLRLEATAEPMDGAPRQPDIFFDHAPCGSYPIIALRTLPCDKYLQGYCSPCGYSARSYPAGLPPSTLYEGIMEQMDWLLAHFDELFVARSNGRLEGYWLRDAPQRPWYQMQLAGESSFFRDAEVPPVFRRKVLERLVAFQTQHGVNFHVMVECRPEHLVAAEQSGELDRLRPLFRALDLVVNMGFESGDEFLRNVAFGKDADKEVFELAVAIAHRHRLDPGVFLFAGSTILTASEILAEVERDLEWAGELGLFVNLMVPNLQSHTLPDLLHAGGHYRLPEPYFLLDLVDLLLDYRPRRPRPVTPFHWFLGGIESDPPPRMNLVTNPNRRATDASALAVHQCVLDLVHTGDEARYRCEAGVLRRHPDFVHHETDLSRVDGRSWPERLADELAFASAYLPTYTASAGAPVDTIWDALPR